MKKRKSLLIALMVLCLLPILTSCSSFEKEEFDYNYSSSTIQFAYDSSMWNISTPAQEGNGVRVLELSGKRDGSRMEIYYGENLNYAGDRAAFVDLQKSNDRIRGELLHGERKAVAIVNGRVHYVWQYKLTDGSTKRIVFVNSEKGEIIIGEIIKDKDTDYKTIEHSVDLITGTSSPQ